MLLSDQLIFCYWASVVCLVVAHTVEKDKKKEAVRRQYARRKGAKNQPEQKGRYGKMKSMMQKLE